ncbi:3115_t:CDS:2 [Entrophospora sp. SA101]|nr:3115_t:CDS:2 [Entrophospora sp. SA101]
MNDTCFLSSASTQSPIPSPINDEDDSTDSINLEQEQNSISLEAETQSTIIAGNEPTFSSEIAEASATVNTSNKSRPPISTLPDDPEEKRKCVIEMALEWCPYLSLDHSNEYSDIYNFNSSVHCPICNKDHEKDNIRNNINGQWGSGDYANTETYRLKCWEACQKSIQIVTVKA